MTNLEIILLTFGCYLLAGLFVLCTLLICKNSKPNNQTDISAPAPTPKPITEEKIPSEPQSNIIKESTQENDTKPYINPNIQEAPPIIYDFNKAKKQKQNIIIKTLKFIWNIILIILKIIRDILTGGYYHTNYYQETNNGYFYTTGDAGRNGEYLLSRTIQHLTNNGGKLLYNCYLNKTDNRTTEVDVILIHSCGIFVFESKNYSGWIFGDENSKTWTQTLPNGNRARKEHFYNPIMQNETHINALKNIVGYHIPIYSVIVFSDRCTLKKVNVRNSNAYVTQRRNLIRTINNITINKTSRMLTQDEIELAFNKLYPYSQVSEEAKRKHINNMPYRK